MSRVLLVHPGTGGRAATAATLAGSEHMGLAYLSAALENAGHDVHILDGESSDLGDDRFAKAVTSFCPAVIGLSPTSKSAPDAVRLTQGARRCAPGALLVWGGHLATGMSHAAFSAVDSLDAVVLGLGEELLPLIVATWEQLRALPSHPRILARAHPPIPTVDVDALPVPSWVDLRPTRIYDRAWYATHGARIVTSLGCPYDCVFCTTPGFSGRRVIYRSISDVVAEIVDLRSRFGINRIWINDDLFVDGSRRSATRARTLALTMMASGRPATFRAMCRANTFCRDPALLDDLQNGGMDAMFVGLESGDDEALDRMSKRTTSDMNRWIAAALRKRGILLQIGFIMFTPGTNEGELRRNLTFLGEIDQLYRLFPLTRTALVFPGTELWATTGNDYDLERSTPFLRYPRFANEGIRQLSIAMEQLEEQFAALDGVAYRIEGERRMDPETRGRLKVAFERLFLMVLDRAMAGWPADRLISEALGSRQEIESLLHDLSSSLTDGSSGRS